MSYRLFYTIIRNEIRQLNTYLLFVAHYQSLNSKQFLLITNNKIILNKTWHVSIKIDPLVNLSSSLKLAIKKVIYSIPLNINTINVFIALQIYIYILLFVKYSSQYKKLFLYWQIQKQTYSLV